MRAAQQGYSLLRSGQAQFQETLPPAGRLLTPTSIAVSKSCLSAANRTTCARSTRDVAGRGVLGDLFAGVVHGMIGIHTAAPPGMNTPVDKPRAHTLAAWQAARARPGHQNPHVSDRPCAAGQRQNVPGRTLKEAGQSSANQLGAEHLSTGSRLGATALKHRLATLPRFQPTIQPAQTEWTLSLSRRSGRVTCTPIFVRADISVDCSWWNTDEVHDLLTTHTSRVERDDKLNASFPDSARVAEKSVWASNVV